MNTINQKQSDKEELVSIIIPAYNSEKFLNDTLDSVLAQSYTNWEAIIVDDFSTDNTAELIKKYMMNDKRIKYYKLDNNYGAAVARNKAIELAKGKYIAFLDSDDIWFHEKLSKQINFMKKKNLFFTCTSYTKIDENGKFLNRIIKSKPKSNYDGLLKTCPGNSTVVYDCEKLGKFFIPNIKKRNDYVMWLQVIKKSKYLYGLKKPLGSHRIRNNAISSNKFSLVGYHWKVYREIENISIIKSSYLIIYWIVATVFKMR